MPQLRRRAILKARLHDAIRIDPRLDAGVGGRRGTVCPPLRGASPDSMSRTDISSGSQPARFWSMRSSTAIVRLTKRVEMRLSADDGKLTVEVRDQGAGFRIEEVPDPRLPENMGRPSGRGLTMARGLMDEFHVDCGSGGTYAAHGRRGRRRSFAQIPEPIIAHVHAGSQDAIPR